MQKYVTTLLILMACACAQASIIPYYDHEQQALIVPLITVSVPEQRDDYYDARLQCDVEKRQCVILNLDHICNGFSPERAVCSELPK